ncbi:MFS family permease [Halanaeroarchaeum sp. HSR-CO]|uniref:MFS transporter n=1 Tax=Halanaeroarchaeum sp. HSR-CO TaxID=2866382 RepID=UPI00217E2090|nr:MFS transporter [Halanaeroarchaeum sp. HSR-CO]UWG46679.1 MFS family permease [Halanaeroarchaeum sp. HSR-CO]
MEDGRFRDLVRRALALERDVLVLSVAMLLFSLSFQMTSRYIPRYMQVLGAGAGAIGLFGSATNLLSALYPYPGGAVSDRIGSRAALTGFGLASTIGFVVWLVAEWFGTVTIRPPSLPTVDVFGVPLGGTASEPIVLPIGIFLGLVLTQAWKSLGLGATFAIVKQSAGREALATGFASTETFRRLGFLLGPLLAAGVLAIVADFPTGFGVILAIAAGFALVGTITQHVRYDPSADTVGASFEGLSTILADLRSMPAPLRPLLVGDTLVRFANGMVYVFFVIVVTDYLAVGFSLFGRTYSPEAFFGVLLAVEMVVALLTMIPVGRLADRYGHKPVVALGFAVYALFPVLLILAPANAAVMVVLFAFSGLRFAGLPAHKALIVGPAAAGAGGRVTGTYYLLRNTIVIPSAAIGGFLYAQSPTVAFATASVVGLLGTGYFLVFGTEMA